MTVMVWTYVAYLIICVGVTIWVARTLRKHGRVVLSDGIEGRQELSEAFSHLLVVGFYLINFGVICFNLKIASQATDSQTAIEMVSLKIGTILVVLGAMHFLVFAVFAKLRSTSNADHAEKERLALVMERRRKSSEKSGDSVWEAPPEPRD